MEAYWGGGSVLNYINGKLLCLIIACSCIIESLRTRFSEYSESGVSAKLNV